MRKFFKPVILMLIVTLLCGMINPPVVANASSSSDEWNNRLKKITVAATKQIPKAGFIVSLLISELWPDSKPSVWDEVKNQTAALIDQKILAKEYEDRKLEIDSLRDDLKLYDNMESMSEKAAWLPVLISKANGLGTKFLGSSNAIHLIQFSIITAEIHLTLLRERVILSKEMYGYTDTTQLENDLKAAYNKYAASFPQIFEQWKTWRSTQIEVNYYSEGFITYYAYGNVTDHVTNEYIHHVKDNCPSNDYYKGVCVATKERMLNDAIAKMLAEVYAPAFYFNNYIIGEEDSSPIVYSGMNTLTMGPYSSATISNTDSDWQTNVDDVSGQIKQMYIREWNSIDGIQFIYTDHNGNFTGNPSGGVPNYINIGKDKYATGLRMHFAYGTMCDVEGVFSDGSTTGKLGNRSNRAGTYVKAEVGAGYELVGGSFRKGYGPSSTQEISVIKLNFKFNGNTIPQDNINISCDDAYELYVNGILVGTGSNWSSPQDFRNLPLVYGKNVIAVKGIDQGGVAAMVADATINGKRITTNNSWKVSTTMQDGWNTINYDDSKWSNAKDYGQVYSAPTWGAGVIGFSSDTPAHWIWSSNNDADNTVYFRTTIDIPQSSIKIACDNAYELYINGILVGTGNDWTTPQDFSNLPLTPGKNVIAIKGIDQDGVAAMVADATINGKRLATNRSWKISTTEQSGWNTGNFDDSNWEKATDYGSAYGASTWGAGVIGFSSDTPARWIWSANNDTDNTVYFRTTVDIPQGSIKISCDNAYELYVNGMLVGAGNDWYTTQNFSNLPLTKGKNLIAVKGVDRDGVAAMVADATINGKRIATDNSWKVSTTMQDGWSTKWFNDSSWSNATDYGSALSAPTWAAGLSGFSSDTPAHWIWSSNNDADNTAYFRTTLYIK
ncbi:MAG: hypothetical protein N3B21_11025 [Clostridia bacterium]|nr:hypothetical protein [Clostridia bacterium]